MNLSRLLAPASVAVVGASADSKKPSGMMLGFLQRSGFSGRVYPINPKYATLGGWACYPSIEALPEVPDVAVVALPVGIALDVLDGCARRGIPYVVLMTGGFGEGATGDDGRGRLRKLQDLCRRTGLRVLGPNTVGMVNFRHHLPLTFADWYARDSGQRGGVAILTHSGSVGGLMFSMLQQHRVGVDYWVGLGNEGDLELSDFITHFADDPDVHTLACFVEGLKDGRRFMEAASAALAAGKNLVVLKAGNSAASQRATLGHTGKLSTSSRVYRAVLGSLGVIQVDSLQELAYAVKVVSMAGRRPMGRIGVLSASGGACSLIADHASQAGLSLPELPPPVRERLAQSIPEYGSTHNPVDLSADVIYRRDIMEGTLGAIREDRSVDGWIVFGRALIDRYYEDVAALARTSRLLVMACPGVPLPAQAERTLADSGVVVLDDPELCCRAVGAVQRASEGAAGGTAPILWNHFPRRAPGEAVLDVRESEALLRAYGLPVAKSWYASSLEELSALLPQIEFPVAVKIASRAIAHKTDVGAVRLGISSPSELTRAFADVLAAGWQAVGKDAVEGVHIQRMAEPGLELLVSITQDPDFGPILTVGSGGVHVEVEGDVVVRALPVSRDGLRRMLSRLRMYPLFAGYRGRPPADEEALVHLLARLMELYESEPSVAEIECNPVIVAAQGRGATIVDWLIRPTFGPPTPPGARGVSA